MKRIVMCLTFATLLAGASVSAQHQALAERGAKVYAAQKCAICHSIGGKGNQKGPLDEVGAKLSADEIRMWIVDAPAMTAKAKSTRKPVMRAYASLAKDELEALVAYMQSLKNK